MTFSLPGSRLRWATVVGLFCAGGTLWHLAVPSWVEGQQVTLEVPTTACAYSQDARSQELVLEDSDELLTAAVAHILGYSGIRSNFVVRSSNVEDAMAILSGTTRYVIFNAEQMTKLNVAAKTQWAAVSVLAHEVGHHLSGHTLSAGGSRPEEELGADYYSGFILQKMGVPPESALAAVRALTTELPPASHPPRSQREESIRQGWWASYNYEHHPPNLRAAVSPEAAPQPTFVGPGPISSGSGAAGNYVGRSVFFNDATAYFVTSGQDIVTTNAFGQPVIAGRRKPPTVPGYAWMYSGPTGTYGVDPEGRIWTLAFNRSQVGYIAAP